MFGLKLIVEASHYCRFYAAIDHHTEMEIGRETLSLRVHEGPIASNVHVGFEFETAVALDHFVQRLVNKGISITSYPQDRSWLWRDAIVHDLDGHELLLIFAGNNKLNPPWRV